MDNNVLKIVYTIPHEDRLKIVEVILINTNPAFYVFFYNFPFSPSAVLHFILSQGEKLPGYFPHVAKYANG